MAFRPDGTAIATGSYDTSCRLWRVPDLGPLGRPMEQRGHVWNIAFSPDGSLLAAAYDDNTAQVWNLARYERHGDPLPHTKSVRAVVFSGDGRSILTACEEGSARIWQLGNGPGIGQPMDHSADVRVLIARPDGKVIATAGADGMIRLWDALTTRLIAKQQGHAPATAFELAFNPAGTVLVSGSRDGFVKRWNGATLEPIGTPIRMTSWVRRVAVSPDGTTIAAGDHSGQLGFWDARTGTPLAPLVSVLNAVTSLAFNPDGTRLAVCTSEGEGRIWDMTRFVPVGEPMRHKGSIRTATFSPDGTRLATGSYDKTARIWDVQTMKPHRQSPRSSCLCLERLLQSRRRANPDRQLRRDRADLGRAYRSPARRTDETLRHDLRSPLQQRRVDGAHVRPFPKGMALGRRQLPSLGGAATTRPRDPRRGLPSRSPRRRHGVARWQGRLWSVPSATAGSPDRLAQEITVLTGMELGSDDVVRVLDVPDWKRKRDAFNENTGTTEASKSAPRALDFPIEEKPWGG